MGKKTDNKKIKYILLPLVIIIWALVIIRLVYFIKKPAAINDTRNILNNVTQIDTERDTFILITNYPDPFLGTQGRKTSKTPAKTIKNPVTKPKTTTTRRERQIRRWPQIQYQGLVKSSSSNKITCLIKIKNKPYLVNEGITIEEITINKIYSDSIIVTYMNETRSFYMNK